MHARRRCQQIPQRPASRASRFSRVEQSNRISKPIEIATAQLERGKAKAVHSSGIEVFEERQVISTLFEEDLPHEFLPMRHFEFGLQLDSGW